MIRSHHSSQLYKRLTHYVGFLMLASLAVVPLDSAHAEPMIDEIVQILSSDGFTALADHDLKRKLVESLNDGLRRIDPFAKIHWVDALNSEYSTRVGDGNNFGIELFDAGMRIVVVPFQGGHAYNQGLTEPSFLTSINRLAVDRFDFDTAWKLFRSTQGDEVEIEIESPRKGDKTKASLLRQPFRPSAVELHSSDSVQYIRIRDFRERETRASLSTMLADIESSANPIILDLRYCAGGDLFEAIDTASLFLPSGVSVAVTIDSRGKQTSYRSLDYKRATNEIPILLTGPHTASSAEVFVRALSHYRRGFLVGGKTRGKCSSQTQVTLTSGYQLTYTNLHLLGPRGRPCNSSGLSPDVWAQDNKVNDTANVVEVGIEAWWDMIQAEP